ncbi:rRNA adenine methyltransferase [Chryseolinea sp. T2]|uniref:rRNA adenine methyltransferase n=1 Tax=Chryseolinea sp. T2 TaxID=3129255 RepID=UPI003077D599
MEFAADNHVVKLCAQGMDFEGLGKSEDALRLFLQAWGEASNNFEKFIAAHYVARHQNSVTEKLEWDETALRLALEIDDANVKGAWPSLYLNVGKCYEDLKRPQDAKANYELALSFTNFLHDDGYGNMIRGGIMNGLSRVTADE